MGKQASLYNEFQPKYDCRDQVAVVVNRPTDERRRSDFLMWTMANGEPEWGPDNTPARSDFGAERLAALVLIRDPDANRLDPEVVGDILGLSVAESRVAVLPGTGRSVRDIARELHRSENTVRWTLKNVLAKTNSTRQADLVRLLVQLPQNDRDG